MKFALYTLLAATTTSAALIAEGGDCTKNDGNCDWKNNIKCASTVVVNDITDPANPVLVPDVTKVCVKDDQCAAVKDAAVKFAEGATGDYAAAKFEVKIGSDTTACKVGGEDDAECVMGEADDCNTSKDYSCTAVYKGLSNLNN